MRTYDKRIGFLVSYQTLIPHGGIGQFTKSFIELMSLHNVKVDIITDKAPANSEFISYLKEQGVNIIYPNQSLPYSDHSAIFMFGDSFCYERMVNFRNSIIKALSHNLYDIFVCNTYETVQVAETLGLDDYIQIIAYTHLESQIFKDSKNPFLPRVNEMMRKQLEISGIYIGTQSKFNELQFDAAYELPIPFTELGLLEKHIKPREGVLFIGRWEEGKGPETYLTLIEQTGLPARVMTNANGAKKFEERLKKISADYKIATGIIGKEKVDFITSCRVAFNPSTVESYGIAFYEQITQLPTFVLANQRWTKNFNSEFFFETDKKDMAEDIKGAYERFPTAESWYAMGHLEHVKKKEEGVFHKWNTCFNEFKSRQSNGNTAKICSLHEVRYDEYIESLNRKLICIDDVKSVLGNKHKFNVIYTDNNSYLSKDPSFTPKENLIDDLFE
jgi:glycosyltransferase involved in cell wall biosynthesis